MCLEMAHGSTLYVLEDVTSSELAFPKRRWDGEAEQST